MKETELNTKLAFAFIVLIMAVVAVSVSMQNNDKAVQEQKELFSPLAKTGMAEI